MAKHSLKKLLPQPRPPLTKEEKAKYSRDLKKIVRHVKLGRGSNTSPQLETCERITEIVRLGLDLGGQLGIDLLCIAAQKRASEVVKHLATLGVSIPPDYDGPSPLAVAIKGELRRKEYPTILALVLCGYTYIHNLSELRLLHSTTPRLFHLIRRTALHLPPSAAKRQFFKDLDASNLVINAYDLNSTPTAFWVPKTYKMAIFIDSFLLINELTPVTPATISELAKHFSYDHLWAENIRFQNDAKQTLSKFIQNIVTGRLKALTENYRPVALQVRETFPDRILRIRIRELKYAILTNNRQRIMEACLRKPVLSTAAIKEAMRISQSLASIDEWNEFQLDQYLYEAHRRNQEEIRKDLTKLSPKDASMTLDEKELTAKKLAVKRKFVTTLFYAKEMNKPTLESIKMYNARNQLLRDLYKERAEGQSVGERITEKYAEEARNINSAIAFLEMALGYQPIEFKSKIDIKGMEPEQVKEAKKEENRIKDAIVLRRALNPDSSGQIKAYLITMRRLRAQTRPSVTTHAVPDVAKRDLAQVLPSEEIKQLMLGFLPRQKTTPMDVAYG